MKIICYMSDTSRDRAICQALLQGFHKHGEKVDVADTHETCGPAPEYDLAVFVGVRTKGRHVYEASKSIDQQFLMLDKGYFQRSTYHRFSVNAPQPQYFDRMDYDDARFREIGRHHIRPVVRRDANRIIYVEATQKYYSFHGLGHLSDYAELKCGEINAFLAANDRTDLQVVYRPKASARLEKNSDLKPRQPPNTLMSDPMTEPFMSLLTRAHCVVVHGSNAGVEAAAGGVPVLTLGSAHENPLYDLINTRISDLLNPQVPEPDAVRKRVAQLAWCQFNDAEITSGFAWEHTKRWVR